MINEWSDKGITRDFSNNLNRLLLCTEDTVT